MRHTRAALVLGVTAMLAVGGLSLTAGATSKASVDRQTYVADTFPLDPYATERDEPRVGTALGQTTTHGLIHFGIERLSEGAELQLTVRASSGVSASLAAMKACPVTQPWSVPLDREQPPEYDCTTSVALASTGATTWTLLLVELQRYWASHPNHGVAVVPAFASADQVWDIAFDAASTRVSWGEVTSGKRPLPASSDSPGSRVSDPGRSASTPLLPAEALSPQHMPLGNPTREAASPQLAPTSAQPMPAAVVSGAASSTAERTDRPWWPWGLFALALVLQLARRTGSAVRLDLFVSRRVQAFAKTRLARRAWGNRLGRLALVAGGAAASLAVAAQLVPRGIPIGVVMLGVALGGLTSLTALGLVLVFRVVRAINMAQAEIGGLAAALATALVLGQKLPYLVALPAGLAAAVVTGLGIAAVMRRFERAPRLIVMVATIGIAQLLAGLTAALPLLFPDFGAASTLTFPLSTRFVVGPITFNANHVVAMVVVPLILVGLSALLTQTSMGRAMRAVADSTERAELVGVPIRRVMRVTWVAAAVLSAVAAMLSAPLLGPNLSGGAGPSTLLAPLAAAVIGRLENLRVTFVASIALGVLQQVIYWSYPTANPIEVVLLGVILLGLLLTPRSTSRERDQGLGQYAAADEPAALHSQVRRLTSVRLVRTSVAATVAVIGLGAPFVLGEANLVIVTYMAIFGIIAVSLVLLTGWAGEVSLGQFAFAGLGATGTAVAIASHGADLFVALMLGALVAALGAVIVGIPVLRLSGQFAAVTTLAFAIPTASFLLNPTRFPHLNPSSVERPVLLNRFSLDNPRTFYFLCIGFLVLAFLAVRNLRQGRTGRALLAARDNDLAAAAWGISPLRLKMTAFAVSGALAGLAGGLYVVALRGMPFNGFAPINSLAVFTMVVVGGLGSLTGGLLGAVYVGGVQHLLGGYAQLLATGIGLLVLLMVAPGGLGGLLFAGRDSLYRYLAKREGLDLSPVAAGSAEQRDDTPATVVPAPSHDELLRWESVDAGYGKLQILFDLSGEVRRGEILALLGTNGAGKSTLLRVLSGTLHGSSGRLHYDGSDITALSPQERLRQGIVTIPGGHGVFPSLSVEENLKLFGWTIRADEARLSAAIETAYETFPRLRERRLLRASQLSGGEQQMLALSQAFICDSRLLLIDELTLGLAPAVVGLLLDVLKRLSASGVTIVLVEQSLNTAASIAQRCVFMERGRVRYDGSLAQLMERDDLARAVFLTDQVAPLTALPASASANDTPALELRDVAKHWGGIVAVDNVSLTIPRGKIVGLIGPNGAGKTTLLDICSGFVRPDSGQILYNGRDITYSEPETRSERGLGRMFQSARLIPTLTVREVLAVALDRHIAVREPVAHILRLGAARDSELAVWRRVDELLDRFGLGKFADSRIRELSTGTRRVVELACGFAHRPDLLLLDEPTAGIAQKEAESIADMLRRAQQELGLTMVVVEHDLGFISSLADHLVCMELGAVLSSGPPAAVLNDPAVLEAYFGIRQKPQAPRRPRRRAAAAVAPSPIVTSNGSDPATELAGQPSARDSSTRIGRK